MKPYVIVSPDYDYVSGGIKVMWGLYGHLLARGIEVYINRYPQKDFIAVYPEIFGGNPLGAKIVVRYILNELGVMQAGNGIEPLREINPNEHNYYFSQLFGGNKTNTLFLPVINMNTFKDQGKLRNKTAVFIGKGINSFKHPENSVLIDRTFAYDQQSLADLLNECEVLYDYDPVSAMSEVARLCGCRVVYLADKYMRKDYEKKYEPGVNGISFGSDTGEKLDTEMFRSRYMGLKRSFEKLLDLFIEETQR